MNFTYKRKYCTRSIILSIFLILSALFSFLLADVVSAEYVAMVAIISYAIMITCWCKTSGRIDLYLIFLCCTYVFYFGGYLLVILNRDKYYEELIQYYDLKFLNSVAMFILLCICTMNFSINFFMQSKYARKNEKNSFLNQHRINNSSTKIVAWVMFAISFLFSIKMLLVNIANTKIYGYAYSLRTYYSDYRVERFFSTFLLVSFVLLIMVYKKSKKIIAILGMLCVYLVLYFASGSRLQAMLLILTLVLVYEFEFQHLKKASLIKIGLAFLAICFFLAAISSVRNSLYNLSSFENIVENVKDNFSENNFFLKLISEFGFQINSIAVVIDNCPNPEPFNYGLTYLKGVGQLMPNLFWEQNPFMQESTDTIFVNYLNGGTFGIGSSFIAEAYYNFGYFSVLFMFVVGWFFAKYQNGLEFVYKKNNNFLLRYFYLSIPTYVLFYVRSDAVGLFKALVYRSLIPCIAIILVSSLFYRKET